MTRDGTDPTPRRTSPEDDLTERIFRAGDELVHIVLTSFLWVVTSLPLITLPASTAALFGTLSDHVVRGRRGYVGPYFLIIRRSFRTVTWRGILLLGAVVLFGLNAAFYLLGDHDASWARIGGGVQLVACLVAIGWCLRFFDLVGGHWSSREFGHPPGIRAAGRLFLDTPVPTLLAALSVLAVPALLIWLSLWQFTLFTAGIQAYLAVRILHRGDR